MAAITLCLINQKGGCGKSSTCFHLAGAYAALGYSVLLVDADPQGSLSQGFLGSDFVEQLPAHETLAALFDENCFFLDQQLLIRPTGFDGISIVPANQFLADFNAPKPASAGMVQFVVREFLEQQDSYDIVMIDCPPNLYQCSWNSMIAANYVVIPVPPEDFGTQGLRAVHQAIDNARQYSLLLACDRVAAKNTQDSFGSFARPRACDDAHRTCRSVGTSGKPERPDFRSLALQRLKSIIEQSALMGAATVEFPSTESWRVVYEELLRSPGLHLYRSVSYIETPHYWQDGPGQQSTRLNLELHDARVVSIERIAIIADHLWPDDSLFPMEPIHSWLDEQHRHGIWLRLLRESAVGADTELLNDFGIYGNRAVGMQLADPAGRTIRFILSFDFEKLRQAEDQWSRLAVYSISYKHLLDQKH